MKMILQKIGSLGSTVKHPLQIHEEEKKVVGWFVANRRLVFPADRMHSLAKNKILSQHPTDTCSTANPRNFLCGHFVWLLLSMDKIKYTLQRTARAKQFLQAARDAEARSKLHFTRIGYFTMSICDQL